MGLFSTRNSDGASGRGEPVDTIPARDRAKMLGEAARHGCDSVAELVTAPSLNQYCEYDPKNADRN